MPVTYTSTLALSTVSPRLTPANDVPVAGSYNSGATTISAGDVIFLCKVPTGVVVTEAMVFHSIGGTTMPINVGFSDSLTAFLSDATKGTTNRADGIPKQISLTDTADPKFRYLAVQIDSGTSTTSLKIRFSIKYHAKGDEVEEF